MILYRKSDLFYYENGTDKFWLPVTKLGIKELSATLVEISIDYFKPIVVQETVSNITDINGVSYGTAPLDLINGFSTGFGTKWQDQTTDAVIVKFNQVHNSTTLNGAIAVDDYDIIVTSATGIVVGTYIILFDPASLRFGTFYAIGVSGTTITLDTPIDFAYPDGTYVDAAITDMAVNGSVTPQHFGLRGTGAPPGVDLDVDITRIIFKCYAASAVSLDLFGDLAALTNGLVFRARNGRYQNIFNVKSNGDLANLMYDFTPFAATNPTFGQDGFAGRLTFAGPSKIGVAIRLPVGTDVEFIVQDNISGLDKFEVIAEGHIVED